MQGDYFGALDIPLVAGRRLNDRSDAPDTPAVAVISRRMADQFFPGENAVGQRIVVDLQKPVTAEVVGVAADARVFGQASDPPSILYLSSRQFPTNFMNIVVRSAAAPAAVAGPLRQAVHEIDPALAVARVESMRDLLAASVAQPRLRTWLITGFAAVALLLTLIGLYGILAFTVSRRTKTPRLNSWTSSRSCASSRKASRRVLRETPSAAPMSSSERRVPGGSRPSVTCERRISATRPAVLARPSAARSADSSSTQAPDTTASV